MSRIPSGKSTPWHAGERALQQRLGVAERMAEIGPHVIREAMSAQHREFFASLPFVVLASVDEHPWATVLAGAPGFVTSPDPHTLTITGLRSASDPANAGLVVGGSVGVLGIEPHTRRRNRMNGLITHASADQITIRVVQSFGNCPKYIHPRRLGLTAGSEPGPVEAFVGLDARARTTIAAADTMFVASYFGAGEDRQVDVSHRGGPPGFVQVDARGVLSVPDYPGNRFFNTLGNVVVQPQVGLLFVDFASGDLLQLTGDAELILEGDPRLRALLGAERGWTVRPRGGVHRDAAVALRGSFD